MRVFCTGISCSGAGKFVESVSRTEPKIRVFSTGDIIFDIAEKQGRPIRKAKVLDKLDPELDCYRAAAFERILKEVRSCKDTILRTHACFRWKNQLRKAFDLFYLKELEPDYYVTIVDNIAMIKARMEKNLQWAGKLTVKEILIWRDEETLLTQLMANYQEKKFYVIPQSLPVDTFQKIIYQSEIPKIYLSYPMSHATKKMEKSFKEKDETRAKLEKRFVVFDPGDVDDVALLEEAKLAKEEGHETFSMKLTNGEVSFETEEVLQAKNDIQFQTVSLDYKLIDQSDMIVVLYPEAVRSHGVSSEVKYGSANKDVYIVSPLKEDPFTEYDITGRFETIEDLLIHLENSNESLPPV